MRLHLAHCIQYHAPSTRKIVTKCSNFSKRQKDSQKLQELPYDEKVRKRGLISLEKTASGDSKPNSIYDEVIKKTEPGTSKMCSVGGQDTTDLNLN